MDSDDGGSGGSTPVQDELTYGNDGEQPMSVNQPDSPDEVLRKGGANSDSGGAGGNDVGEVREIMSGGEDTKDSGKGDQSDDEGPVGSPMSGPRSPDGESQDRQSGPRSPDQGARSQSASPGHTSRSGSRSPKGRSGSRSPSNRSRSGSGSPGRRSRSGSGSPGRRSRSGSGSHGRRSRSGSGSPGRRSRSGSRSRSPSQGSRAGSKSPDRRSGSGSPSQSPKDRKTAKRSSPGSDVDSDNEDRPGQTTAGKAVPVMYTDDEEESDKESAVGGLIADIFGSSDEDEEFEGFGVADVEAPVKKKEKKKTAVVSDDDDDDEAGAEGGDAQGPDEEAGDGEEPTQGAEGEGDAPNTVADDDDDDDMKEDRGSFVSDFELMMEKKKEESQKYKRKRRDVDIINDNDDLIADMINKMKDAAEEDRASNEKKRAATKKMKYLPAVRSQLKKADLHIAFLDCGILSAMTEWLAPLPDRSLPHVQIRETMLKFLAEFPQVGADTLKGSGIGKAVMYLYKHPKETRENRERAGKLINEWSRPIFNLTSNFKSLSREERQQRDYDQLPKRRRLSSDGSQTPRRDIDKALAGEDKALRPGDPGWVMRARVPNPSHKDYVVRPRWNVEELAQKGASKKKVTRYEKHVRAFQEKKKGSKNQRAVTISIEGRNMSL